MTTQPDTDNLASELADEYVQLTAAKARIDARLDDVKAKLRSLGEGTHDAGTYDVVIAPNRRFDPKRAAELFPIAEHPTLYTTVIESKTAKQQLPPLVYEQCMSQVGEPRVTVR